MSEKFTVSLFNRVNDYINELPFPEQAKVKSALFVLENGDFDLVKIKTLRDDIKELKVKRHRFVFFIKGQTIYFISAFMKKTSKTPKREIENALKIFKSIT
jgi:phage-related protein